MAKWCSLCQEKKWLHICVLGISNVFIKMSAAARHGCEDVKKSGAKNANCTYHPICILYSFLTKLRVTKVADMTLVRFLQFFFDSVVNFK
jgi:hypothetical protein